MGRGRQVFLVARIAASAAMLIVLFTRLHVSELLPSPDASTWLWAAAGVGTMLVAIVLSTVRWQRMLRVLQLPARGTTLFSHYLASLFVSNFLPSTVGGDVLRVVRLSASTGEAATSFASVVLERLTGFAVLPILTLVALSTHPSLLHLGTATRVALGLSVGTLAVLAGVLAVAASPRLGRRVTDRTGWLRFVGAVHLGLGRIRRRPSAAASVVVAAVAYQLTVIGAAWIASRALGLDLEWATVMAFIPVVAIAQVLPLTLNGLGLREGAFVLFLHPLGVPAAQAVALGLLLYGMNLAVSLLGAPAFAAGPRRVPAVRAAA